MFEQVNGKFSKLFIPTQLVKIYNFMDKIFKILKLSKLEGREYFTETLHKEAFLRQKT